jgi:hypothetical protein
MVIQVVGVATEALLRSYRQVGAGLPIFCPGLARTSAVAVGVAIHGPPAVGCLVHQVAPLVIRREGRGYDV